MEEKAESLLLLLNGKVKPSFPYSINMSWGITYINIFEFLVANHKFDFEGIWLILSVFPFDWRYLIKICGQKFLYFGLVRSPSFLTCHDNNLSFLFSFLYRSNWHLKCIQWFMLFYFGYGWFYYGLIIHLEVRISAYSFFNMKLKVECSYSEK